MAHVARNTWETSLEHQDAEPRAVNSLAAMGDPGVDVFSLHVAPPNVRAKL